MPTCLRLTYLVVIVVVACRHEDPNFCENAPHHNCLALDAQVDAPADALNSCAISRDCAAPKAVCDVGAMTCVQCTTTEHDACVGNHPACGNDHTCRGCTAHPECPTSLACLPDGSCGTDANVAYVDPSGTDNNVCSFAMPCTVVAKALATGKTFIKFHGTTNEPVSINNQNVTLLADPGAQLTRPDKGLLLEVRGSSQVAIYDLELTAASGPNGFGISLPAGNTATLDLHRARVTFNAGGGISATGGIVTISGSTISDNQTGGISVAGGTVTISESTISDNQGTGISATNGTLTVSRSVFRNNQGGGISEMNGAFILIGNVLFNNGGNTSLIGGVVIGTGADPANRLEFNSFNQNTTQAGIGPAIQCVGTFTAKNNIMSGNGSLTQMDQTGGTCTHIYSIARPGVLPAGAGNSGLDPLFVNPVTGDLHIQSTSPARRAADPNSDLSGVASHDIDGTPRISPADTGAYQLK